MTFKTLSTTLINVVFPQFCVGCGVEGSLLCQMCLDKIDSDKKDEGCPLCGDKSNFPRLCSGCRNDTELVRLISIGSFGGALREALHELKFNDVRQLSSIIADILARRLKDLDTKPGIIIPIPLSSARARERI